MKVLFEVPLESSDYQRSQFEWLNDGSNRLFLIEDGKRLKTLSIDTEPGKVLVSANLADTRTCTNLSWNKDGNVLAMVVDRRLIYFWDVRNNNLRHYKPATRTASETNSTTMKGRAMDVEEIVWSKTTNKVVIGYSSGHLVICNYEASLSEILIDNSNGVLREISMIESSSHQDIFACTTVIFELLVMTFDGDALFYNQGDERRIHRMKFSPPFELKLLSATAPNRPPSKQSSQAFWLAFNYQDGQILFKLIELKERQLSEAHSRDNIVYDLGGSDHVVHYHWIDSINLIVCSALGIISLVQMRGSGDKSSAFNLNSVRMLEINPKDLSAVDEADNTVEREDGNIFKSFRLIPHNDSAGGYDGSDKSRDKSSILGKSFSFAAMTMYKLFYYELLEVENESRYTLEKVDELDLTGSLQKIGLKLERLEWSLDNSMLAVQLTNGHILIYQTRLRDYMVASHGAKTAYLSEPNEITVLNYGLDSKSGSRCHSPLDRDASSPDSTGNVISNASIIMVDLKPSVIAIGPKHLAIALNNVVRFYSVEGRNYSKFVFQEEYASIVSALCLCSNFVSVKFNDNRVKLHPLRSQKLESEHIEPDNYYSNERFFPDPTNPESISAFTLTEHTFIYCTTSCNLYVFSFQAWCHIQSYCFHKDTQGRAIINLVPNGKGNKYVCLVDAACARNQCRVFLYDSYRNEMTSFYRENRVYSMIFESQLKLVPSLSRTTIESIPYASPARRQMPDLSRVSSAIWDTDGRSVLLVERKHIHICVVLDHTLEQEESIVELVATVDKLSTYATLYASHGVISFQTRLGRVINSISESHDDDAKLSNLGDQIQAIISRLEAADDETGRDESHAAAQAEIMRLKLEYLQSIMAIYPLSKCAEICEYIMSESQFNVDDKLRLPEVDDVLWRQLAARAIFTSNLRFALLVYKRRRLQVLACGLSDIIDDSSRLGFDSKASVRTRLLILLGCELDD